MTQTSAPLHITTRNALDGSDVPAAIKALNAAGHTVTEIALSVQVSRSTVYRWRSGKYRPSLSNFDKLSKVISDYAMVIEARPLSGPRAASQLAESRDQRNLRLLTAAREAMMTDQDRREEADLITRLRADLDAREEKRYQIAGRIAGTDPFALLRTNEMEIPF